MASSSYGKRVGALPPTLCPKVLASVVDVGSVKDDHRVSEDTAGHEFDTKAAASWKAKEAPSAR